MRPYPKNIAFTCIGCGQIRIMEDSMNISIISENEFPALFKKLSARGADQNEKEQIAVRAIIENIKKNGDCALFSYTKQFDGFAVDESSLRVTSEEFEIAEKEVPQRLLNVLKESAKNIREYHNLQKREGFTLKRSNGAMLTQKIRPLERVGVYVPGGKASYPSSVLMNVIPAKVAGVKEIFVATPPDSSGRIPPLTLMAAREAGADVVYKMGGAQAIAAFAYGTQSVPRVDKVTGPGNIFVALAKREVFGQVGIDMVAGPSEVLVIADENANARFVAADLLSQAEHDEQAACIAIVTSEKMAHCIAAELSKQAATLPRNEIIKKSISEYGTIIITSDLSRATAIANQIAPEHLELCVANPHEILPFITNAGSVFVGNYSPEPLGDYMAGTNHILPTNGTARFASPLSVDNFVKKYSVLEYTKEAFNDIYQSVSIFANAEGLDAHAHAATIRFDDKN